mmetsp:Transcript_13341/g.22675  ORF Transcript_13341/g.22675 Transcript_13341/m.22675 type:complete len:102 (+) Transcript_13341:216-521(+)
MIIKCILSLDLDSKEEGDAFVRVQGQALADALKDLKETNHEHSTETGENDGENGPKQLLPNNTQMSINMAYTQILKFRHSQQVKQLSQEERRQLAEQADQI